MLTADCFVAPLELKFADGGEPGEFSGYASVFGNEDSHGDVVLPGAFADSLAEHKARGTMPALFVEHGAALGGDPLPAGVWREMDEDERGLKVRGKISALDTDHGRRVRSLMQDGALRGLSIGFQVRPGGSVMRAKSSDPRRQLKSVNLLEVSLVRDGSNRLALVDGVKSVLRMTDGAAAAQSIGQAIALHQQCLSGSDSPTNDERAQLLGHLQDAHEALTGSRTPPWIKAAPATIREFETALRERFAFSAAEARRIAETGFKSLGSRDESGGKASKPDTTGALHDIGAALAGFNLPSLR